VVAAVLRRLGDVLAPGSARPIKKMALAKEKLFSKKKKHTAHIGHILGLNSLNSIWSVLGLVGLLSFYRGKI